MLINVDFYKNKSQNLDMNNQYALFCHSFMKLIYLLLSTKIKP